MRPRRSTVMVFVGVAAAWFSVFFSFWITAEKVWVESEGGYSEANYALLELLQLIGLVMVWPTLVAMETYESVFGTTMGDWLGWATLPISAATWAALITVAFVLARRLRERCAAK